MPGERRSLQDRIRERQQSGFIGRQGQVIQYQENFGLPVEDERRRFLFNIHGDAGVGKTFLVRQLRQIAASTGALTAYIDETAEDVTSAMTALLARTAVTIGLAAAPDILVPGVFLPRSMLPLQSTRSTRSTRHRSIWPCD